MRSRLSSVVRFAVFFVFAAHCIAVSGCTKRPPINPFVPSPELEVSSEEALVPFQFAGVKSGVRRGTIVGVRYGRYTQKGEHAICNLGSDGYIKWNAAREVIGTGGDDFGLEFYQNFKEKGYNVVNDPEELFSSNERVARAPLQVAASITNVVAAVCDRYSAWDYRPLMTMDAEVDILVEWTVYDTLLKKKVLEVMTRGYIDSVDSMDIGFETGLIEAFGVAARELSNNKEFRDVMSRPISVTSEGGAAELERPDTPFPIPFVPLSKKTLTDNPTRYQMSTVLINGVAGHGSGYVIGKNGLVITNAHVVGTADNVRVRFFEGYEVPGRVIRKNVARDVALVKVEMNGLWPLAVRSDPVKVAEKVYAIGAPQAENLGWTVSSGIVSAYRNFNGLKLIQSDVDTHGGNSGGPLLDENGNLVGMCVAGRAVDSQKYSVGLNYFIPVQDALKMLNIRIERP